jgi:hypothetical protein
MRFQRLAGIAGLVFVVMLVANGALLGSQPTAGDDLDEVRDYVTTDIGMHKTALFIGMLGFVAAVLFFAGIIAKLRASDAEHDEGWGIVALLGAVLLGAGAGVSQVLYATAVFRGGEALDDATLRIVWDGQLLASAACGIALAILAGAVAIGAFARHLWPMWHGALSVLVAAIGVASLTGMVSDTDGGTLVTFIGFAALAVWVLATGLIATFGHAIAPRQSAQPAPPVGTAMA